MMRILIDIGHPAHIHYWRNFANIMIKKGNEIIFTSRDKEITIELLKQYQFDFHNIGKPYKGLINKAKGLITFNYKLFKIAKSFKPDIFLSAGSPYAAHISSVLRKPHIALEDTGNKEQVRIYKPFTSVILTSDIFPYNYGSKQVRFSGHLELAYLIPKYFIPDESIFDLLQIGRNEKYAIIRFVSWNATHDYGQKGMSINEKLEFIYFLKTKMRVFISSEAGLPSDLMKYKFPLRPDMVHSALHYADLFIGEGTTMAMEAAILGTPSFYINTLQYSNCRDMEKYGLLFSFSSFNNLISSINSILNSGDYKNEWQIRKEKMLGDKIELTAFLVWFVENYPESFMTMRKTPEYQYNFK